MKPDGRLRTIDGMANERGTPDEARLWLLSRDGDPQAFGAIFDLHRDRVFSHALRLLGSWADAEDVAAAAFLELFRRRSDVRVVRGSVLPWLLVTTANLARNSSRAKRRHRDFLARLPRASEAASVEDRRSIDLDPRLLRALRELPEADLALLALVALEDFAIADAAAALGITPAAAKTRLHRARDRVRRNLPDFLVVVDQMGDSR